MTIKKKQYHAALIVSGVLLAVAASIYLAGVQRFQTRFMQNTTLNGQDVSGLTVNEVENLIDRAVKKYSLTITGRGETEVLTAEEAGYRFASKGEVGKLMAGQDPYAWPLSYWKSYLLEFEAAAAYDPEVLKKSVEELVFFDKSQMVAPSDAYLVREENGYRLVESVEGSTLDEAAALEAIEAAVAAGETAVDLEEAGAYKAPSVRTDDPALNDSLGKLNLYCGASAQYDFGESKETVDGSTIVNWVSYDPSDGSVELDREQVAAYVAGLAETYDTYGKPRPFHTSLDNDVTVYGGCYGWLIDQGAETESLYQWILNGNQGEKPVAYAQEAVTRENHDVGDSYIEIDLSNQKVYLYIDGERIVETSCVSGTVTEPSRKTPEGSFTLYYKTGYTVLRGPKKADGKYEWESPVNFWMPFNGGIGLHDATWRGEFGGDIFRWNGSHGCINLPYSAAQTIYEHVYKGIPVICYYRPR